jgi:hypothetical protein
MIWVSIILASAVPMVFVIGKAAGLAGAMPAMMLV